MSVPEHLYFTRYNRPNSSNAFWYCCMFHCQGQWTHNKIGWIRSRPGKREKCVLNDVVTPKDVFVWDEVQWLRSQWPRGLRCGSAAARLLGLWVRIPRGSWLSLVSVVCCQRFLCRVDLPMCVRVTVCYHLRWVGRKGQAKKERKKSWVFVSLVHLVHTFATASNFRQFPAD